jgi:small subunit ribosomal protein S18
MRISENAKEKRDNFLQKKLRKKSCWFCENKSDPDYKADKSLYRYISDRGKILPQRYTGTCTLHQRRVAVAVKRARHLAMIPFVAENIR